MILTFILNTFFVSFLTMLLKNRLGRNGVIFIIFCYNTFFFFFVIYNFIFVTITENAYVSFFSDFSLFSFGFYFDFIAINFVCLIVFITYCVFLFTLSYMYMDLRISFFCSLIQFFMFFMLILVSASNLIQLFVGWEGVGVISFLLINFWYTRLDSNKGAIKAVLFNRIGDVGYLLFLAFFFSTFNSSDILICVFNINLETYILWFLILAGFGKSAQIFLYAWLPDAMEGPTPVSSLLHSATMVTAGVFLFIRLFFLFNNNELFLYFLVFCGSLTSILTGVFSCVKFDLKKIIAFSTCSQLGLMISALGFGLINACFFHLFLHAFFKCLLFVSSGIIIHALYEEQDIRKLMSSFFHIPLFYIFILIGSLSLTGFLFFSGFYSKEIILLFGLLSENYLMKSFVYISSICTVLYSIRLLSFFFGIQGIVQLPKIFFLRNKKKTIDNIYLISMLMLSVLSIIIGFLLDDFFLNYDFCFKLYTVFLKIEVELLSFSVVLLIIFSSIYAIFVYCFILNKTNSMSLLFFKYCNWLYNLILMELCIPIFYWLITRSFSYIAYNYIMLCYERLVLDKVFIFFPYTFVREFYSYNKTVDKTIDQLLQLIFFSFSFFFVFVFFPLDICTFFFFLFYFHYYKILNTHK